MKSKLGEIFSGVCENILRLFCPVLRVLIYVAKFWQKIAEYKISPTPPPLPPAAVALFREDELTEGRMNGQV